MFVSLKNQNHGLITPVASSPNSYDSYKTILVVLSFFISAKGDFLGKRISVESLDELTEVSKKDLDSFVRHTANGYSSLGTKKVKRKYQLEINPETKLWYYTFSLRK